jgi:hypothetical protein
MDRQSWLQARRRGRPGNGVEILVHQDITSYAAGLRNQVLKVIGTGVSFVRSAYSRFGNFGVNQAAIAELQSSSVAYQFEYFSA